MEFAPKHQKPHPEAVLYQMSTGEKARYPEGRSRDVAQDVADARRAGYCVAVPAVKTASGRTVYVSIEPQVGGLTGLDKVLRSQRRVGTGENTTYVRSLMLASEWAALPSESKAALADTSTRRADPRDAEIASLRADLAKALAAASPPKGK